MGPAGARTARKGPLDSGYEPGFDVNLTLAARSRSECGSAGGFASSVRALLATLARKRRRRRPAVARGDAGERGVENECAGNITTCPWLGSNLGCVQVPGYGFGIAVSGGRDNPHFVNGEPSIAISDVLRAGPAEGKLQINDRVISANGLPLENVDYATAVQVLRECGNSVNLVIRRRVVLPSSGLEPQTLRVTLTKAKKKDDYGIVLGCRIYVKEVSNKSVAEKDGGVQEGDVVLKINGSPAEGLTLKEARKLLEGSKERLQLVLRREGRSSGGHPGTDQTARWSSGHQFDANHKDASPNFVDVTGARPHWSNQNLYVQPPTRGRATDMEGFTWRSVVAVFGDYRPPPPPERADEKNNLSRGQAGRNRGPLLDISLSQLDQPVGQPPGRDADGTPPRPPPPRVNEYGSRRDKFDEDPLARRGKAPACDPRYVSFQKEGGSVGIRLTGGNRVGIFVTAVQPGSPASLQGLQAGDKILKVNNLDTRGMTREEAVLLLLNLQDQVHLVAQYCRDEYDEIVASQKGDSFYIRTHFSYESGGKGELSFHVGEVFRVVDTLHNGTVGSWLVFRLGRNHQEIQKGVIPNRTRAEELSQAQQSQAKKEASAESSRGSFFKRRSARRAKALCKDHWEDVLCDGLSKFPAYERVTLKHPGFIRPVVLFGPMADVARDKLLRDYPDKYASPQLDGHLEELPKSQKASGIIRLSAIKEIIDKSKHALLDITPSAVDRLNYAQFYPVVVFMRAESKHTVKELRSRLARTPHHKSARKLYDRALKLERLWGHIFTSTVTLTSADMWYKKLRETIEKQQQLSIWVSESKPEEAISDDFLFPMTSRLSYASSPESDLDLACPSEGRALGPEDRRLMRASSDPSVATQEDAFAAPPQQPQPAPPPYSSASPGSSTVLLRAPRPEQGLHSHQSSQDYGSSKRNTLTSEQRYQVPAYSGHEPPSSGGGGRPVDQQYYGHLNGHAEGYPSEEQFPPGTGSRLHGDPQDTYGSKPRLLPEPPPQVDRGSKPPRFSRSAQERLFGSPGRGGGEPPPQGLSPDYINTGSPPKSGSLDRPNGRPMPGYDSSSYSSDSYGRYAGLHQQPHPTANPHDPYRFTRSTAQPPHGARPPPGRGGPAPLHSPPRTAPDRQAPQSPPKPPGYQPRLSDGRPVPPPKPAHYRPRPWSGGEEPGPPPYSSREGSNGYAPRPPPAPPSQHQPNGGPYLNLPHPPRAGVPPAGLLDLSNREHRGSAFELYRKPEPRVAPGHAPYGPAHVAHGGLPEYANIGCPEEAPAQECPPGGEVVATASGVFGAAGGCLSSPETGVSIVVPQGAIPEGVSQEIFFKVCRDSSMLPPLDRDKGETLLSPLVMCGPHGLKFRLPVELRLPHCAALNPESWSFALKSSDTPDGKPAEWQNVSLDNMEGVMSSHVEENYVSVLVDHF
ncbi:tight junction protein tama, putative [Ixodes scapularis]|uniref:Tight junction protein tama, putative n=2 Tax=Ixodes TaxID=6944 RepID=B7PTH6_IXOSC|nr:tight junction protein tama, putative [Ixodes scapularis]|eukprot:XP_002404411.1 tight junction protein tama, putative [Ixodes scapularis]